VSAILSSAVHMRSTGIPVGTVSLFLAAALGCGAGDLVLPGSGEPAGITILRGNNQSGSAGTILRDSILVKVTDSAGAPLPGQQVAFTPNPEVADALVIPRTALTDSNGIAGARWVLGSSNGTQALMARVVGTDDVEVAFQAFAGSAQPRRIEPISGEGQAGVVGTALADPLVVLVTDEFGNPVANVSVDWEANEGSVNPRSSTTGVDGRAQTSWVLGSSTGSQTATASSDGLEGSPLTFTSTGVPGTANALVAVSGNGQSGEPGEQLAEPLVVRLVDREGNGIPGQAVSWVVGAGGGSLTSTSSITDEDGEARTRWSLGPTAGSNSVSAVVSGLDLIGFTATAVAGGAPGGSVPSRMAFKVQPTNLAHRHQIISPPVEVEILDQFGSRITDREFTIRLDLIEIQTGRSKGFDERRTRSGVAVFDELQINGAGEFRLVATTDGVPSVNSEPFVVNE
jgi:hypothetical protein